MEKYLYIYRNRLRNGLIIAYWATISLCSFYMLTIFYGLTNFNHFENFLSLLLFSLITMIFLWPVKIFKTIIYIDTIVFKERGWHPLIRNEFGIAFENISNFKVQKIIFNLNWIVFNRKNGKTIKKLFSLSEFELIQLSNILHEKVKGQIHERS